ncbi:MAG: response regulator [Chloroflexi bacterium]|nr:response regulator [Chloroflexota bacterium]
MSKKILLADDDGALRALIVAALGNGERWRLLEARNGLEALALARMERPDLVLMDMSMPYLNGMEVSRQLKADPETKGLAIILITGFPQERDRESAQQIGVEYFPKPFSPAALLKKVEEVLGR